jgi:hypothetical protein
VGSALFKELGIAGVSAKYRSSAEVKAAKEQAQAQEQEEDEGVGAATASGGRQKKKKKKDKAKAVGHSGRGASDYFLLEVSLGGVATEILRDHSTVRTRTPVLKSNATQSGDECIHCSLWEFKVLAFSLRAASRRNSVLLHLAGSGRVCPDLHQEQPAQDQSERDYRLGRAR